VSFYLNAPRADVSTSAAPVDLNAIRGVDAIEPAAAASAVPRRNLLMSDCRASETGIKGVPGCENWAVQRRGAAAAASNYRAFSRAQFALASPLAERTAIQEFSIAGPRRSSGFTSNWQITTRYSSNFFRPSGMSGWTRRILAEGALSGPLNSSRVSHYPRKADPSEAPRSEPAP